jgi:tRNA nucleotidyltransferase/poly(A) polymerase
MSDYNFLMESRLSPEQFAVVNHLSRIAAGQGLNLYLVGGAVRDLTYGQQVIRDLDFAVEGNVQRILRSLASRPREGELAVPIGIERQRFDAWRQTSEVMFTNGVQAEIGITRNEVYSKPGRRPEISPSMIFEDLKRRDFSANAMAVSLHPNSRGLLLDPTNGAADIAANQLRALHSRSFMEDPSRIYRLLRLGSRLNFHPEERTKVWLEMAIENRAWERLDPEQQGRELRAILREENPARVLKVFVERKLLAGLDRKLAAARLPYEQFEHVRSTLRLLPAADGFLLNFHALVGKLGAGQRIRLAKKIIGDPTLIKAALGMEGAARKLARALTSARVARPSQVYALLSGQAQALLLFLLVNFRQGKIQTRVKNYLFKYPQVRAQFPRAELLALGAEPGPKFEKIVEQLFLDQLDGKITTHQQLLKAFRALAGIKEPAPKPHARPAPAEKPAAKPRKMK